MVAARAERKPEKNCWLVARKRVLGGVARKAAGMDQRASWRETSGRVALDLGKKKNRAPRGFGQAEGRAEARPLQRRGIARRRVVAMGSGKKARMRGRSRQTSRRCGVIACERGTRPPRRTYRRSSRRERPSRLASVPPQTARDRDSLEANLERPRRRHDWKCRDPERLEGRSGSFGGAQEEAAPLQDD